MIEKLRRNDRNKNFTLQPFSHTHRSLETLKGDIAPYRVPDLRCRGLAIRVAPSGSKSWDLVFRIRGGGKIRRISLGGFPGVSLEDARARAHQLTSAAQAGRDLVAEERQAKAAAEARITVAALVEKYLNREVRGKRRRERDIVLRFNRALRTVWDRYADELKRREIRELLDSVAGRGAPREAEHQRIAIGGMFRWAISQDLLENDPTAGLRPYGTGERRERVLAAAEIRALWNWLPDGLSPDYADILQLQLATGARVGEISGLDAEEVDPVRWIWTLPAARSKNKRPRATPIIGIARQIVQRRLDLRPSGALFHTASGGRVTSMHLAGALTEARRRGTIPIDDFRTHDLRRSCATNLVELGFSLDLTAAVLGHETEGTKNVRTLVRHYIRTDLLDRKTAALQAWDAHLRAIISGVRPASNVTNILDLRSA